MIFQLDLLCYPCLYSRDHKPEYSNFIQAANVPTNPSFICLAESARTAVCHPE